MKKSILPILLILIIIKTNAQSYEVQMRPESTAPDIDVMLNRTNSYNTNYKNNSDYPSYYDEYKYKKTESKKPIDNWTGYWKIELGLNISKFDVKLIGANHYQILSINNKPIGQGMIVSVETNETGFIKTILVSTKALPNDFQGLNTNYKNELGYPEYIDNRMVWWGKYKVLSTEYSYSSEIGKITFGYK